MASTYYWLGFLINFFSIYVNLNLFVYIGDEAAYNRNISCNRYSSALCGAYDSTVNPSILLEWSTAIMRMFHSMVPDTANLYDSGKF